MSIILKGVDLPKGYKALHMRVQSDGVVRYLIEGDDPVHIIDGARAIQIPKDHGRLIDRDDIYIGRWDIDSDLAEQIQNAPTILEAET